MSIANLPSLSLMASSALPGINGLPMPRLATPMIASAQDEGALTDTLDRSPVDSFQIRLPEPPAFTWTKQQWLRIVARQTLTENNLHTPPQENIDKLVDIMTRDDRYMLSTSAHIWANISSVSLVLLMAGLAVISEETTTTIHILGLPGSIVCCVLLYYSLTSTIETQMRNNKLRTIPALTITREQWGEEMPRPEQVDEESVHPPLL